MAFERIQKAHKAGVKIVFGSDAYYQAGKLTRGQSSLLPLRVYAAAGLTSIEVIRSATMHAADLLGQGDKIGSLEKSKYADIIAVPGNPLDKPELLENVVFVMKEGLVIMPKQKF